MKALVIKSTGSWVDVKCGDRIVNCKVKGNLRLKGLRCTNPVAVGDWVDVEQKTDGSAFITRVEPRTNYIIRRASNLSKEFQILAANLSQALLVATLAQPETSTTFIDRFLATAEAYNVPAHIIINKVDLLATEEDRELLEAVTYLYRSIGYGVTHVSVLTGQGMDALRELLIGKTSMLAGNSGVGKSSIINAVLPSAALRVGQLSAVHHTGMHTTTFSEMLPLPHGGAIIDTPGVKGFGTIDFNAAEVAHYFPEIFKISAHCRFNNCTHVHEPGCAVLQAVADHRISESRYASYLNILQDDLSDKYRKPF